MSNVSQSGNPMVSRTRAAVRRPSLRLRVSSPSLHFPVTIATIRVDLWAVGCIIGELFLFSPLFPGQSDIEQLYIVVQTLGTPTDETWPGRKSLPDYAKIVFHETKGKDLGEILAKAPDYTADLVKSFLVYDSTQRLPAAESLRHHFFKCKLKIIQYPSNRAEIYFVATHSKYAL